MNQADRHEAAELARLRKQLASAASTDFEREDAARRIKAIVDGPTCTYCDKLTSTHGDGICQVLSIWQRRHGKGSIPSPIQAAELRRTIAEKDKAKDKADRARALKNAQTKLF